MGFNDEIFKLTGGKSFTDASSINFDDIDDSDESPATKPSDSVESKNSETSWMSSVTATETKKPDIPQVVESGGIGGKWSSEYGNPDQDYVIESDLVTPVIKAVKDTNAKPLIVIIDDDFETLDLLEIYLKRDYTYEGFSGPREAVFYLNQHVPEIVFLDCKIHTMKALTVMEIIRTGAGNENVPFVLLGSDSELEAFDLEVLPDYVIGKLRRPVARGELMKFIDMVLNKNKTE